MKRDDDRPDDRGLPPLGAQILRLSERSAPDPEKIVGGLRDYWRSLCKGRAIPTRADVEPRGIREALDYSFILERIAPGAARFRLAGRHLLDLMGMEVRGMPLCSVIEPRSRGRLSDVVETVFRAPQLAELALASPAAYSRPALTGTMLLLPLRSDLGDVTRALGCLIAPGDAGMTPRRFEILSDKVTPVIEGARVLTPQPSDHELAEAPAGWRPTAPADPVPETSGHAASFDRRFPPPTPLRQFDGRTPEERRQTFRVISDDPPGTA